MRLPVLLVGPNAEHDLRKHLNAGLTPRESLSDLQAYYERTRRPHLARVVLETRARLGAGATFRDPDWGHFS